MDSDDEFSALAFDDDKYFDAGDGIEMIDNAICIVPTAKTCEIVVPKTNVFVSEIEALTFIDLNVKKTVIGIYGSTGRVSLREEGRKALAVLLIHYAYNQFKTHVDTHYIAVMMGLTTLKRVNELRKKLVAIRGFTPCYFKVYPKDYLIEIGKRSDFDLSHIYPIVDKIARRNPSLLEMSPREVALGAIIKYTDTSDLENIIIPHIPMFTISDVDKTLRKYLEIDP